MSTSHSRTRVDMYLYLSAAIAAILILLPFHAFFTTWIGATVGHLDAVRIWKELVICAMSVAVLAVVIRDKRLRRLLYKDWLLWLIGWYALLQVLFAVAAVSAGRVNGPAVIYALLANLRFLGFFVIVYVVSLRHDWLGSRWAKIVFYPAAVVIVFGLLQKLLPADFLTHFGYGSNTIPAFQTIDNKLAYIRIQSFLRGANPLGAYMVLVLSLATALLIRTRRYKSWLTLFVLGGGLVLLFSFSRSAWIGMMVSLFLIGYWSLDHPHLKRGLLAAAALMVLIAVGGLYAVRNNDTAQNALFHTSEQSQSSESSNEARSQAIESGWNDVANEPFGRGPGTAGPASVRNNRPARIAENYYLQIGQETGVLGMLLFGGIIALLAYRLFGLRKSPLALGLLAGLIGISLINMLSHAWADDTLALMFFGLCGIALASAHKELQRG